MEDTTLSAWLGEAIDSAKRNEAPVCIEVEQAEAILARLTPGLPLKGELSIRFDRAIDEALDELAGSEHSLMRELKVSLKLVRGHLRTLAVQLRWEAGMRSTADDALDAVSTAEASIIGALQGTYAVLRRHLAEIAAVQALAEVPQAEVPQDEEGDRGEA